MTDHSPFERVRDVVGRDRDLTIEDVSERSGVPIRILESVFKAADRLHEDGRYSNDDLHYAEVASALLDAYPLKAVIRAARVRNRALTSIVVNDLSLVREQIIRPALAGGADPDQLAEMLGDTAEEILPLVSGSLADEYRHILLRILDTEVAREATTHADDRLMLAIGFVDVVGYTALSARVDPTGLDEVLASFETLVTEAVEEQEGVLLAKFIGDAAMIVAEDPVDLAHVLLEIVTGEEELADTPRSAGMSCGPVLVREGDYFGDPVNLAARLTDLARSGSLLADEELEAILQDDFELTTIPKKELHGIGKRRPLRVRELEDEGDGDDGDDDE
ncbi:MAG: adenylate/guanylate cyclase domain-containing protein [Actinobacteria bacterium]|nr:adenylate/guanylate cyclase domain-containing protein [Actinomycetota bacterium]